MIPNLIWYQYKRLSLHKYFVVGAMHGQGRLGDDLQVKYERTEHFFSNNFVGLKNLEACGMEIFYLCTVLHFPESRFLISIKSQKIPVLLLIVLEVDVATAQSGLLHLDALRLIQWHPSTKWNCKFESIYTLSTASNQGKEEDAAPTKTVCNKKNLFIKVSAFCQS